jgi:predicted PurR-regulated permease PerM
MKTVLKNRWVRFIGLLLIIALGLRVLFLIRNVLIPFSLALIVAYIFDPVVGWMQHRKVFGLKLNRGLSIGLLLAFFAVFIGLFATYAVSNIVSTTTELFDQEKVQKVIELLPEQQQWIYRDIMEEKDPTQRRLKVQRLLAEFFTDEGRTDAVSEGFWAVLAAVFTTVFWVFQFFLFFVVTIYLLLDIDRVRDVVRRTLPLNYKEDIIRIAHLLDVNLKAFFRGQCVVVAVLSVIFSIGLWIVGCPYWYIVGITGGIGAFVPYFWLASGMVPAVILSWAKHGNALYPLLVAAVFGVGLTIDTVLVTPKVIGKRVGIHPVLIILSILIFGTLFGFLGILFAVPIAAVVKVFTQELFARYRASEWYTGPTGQESEA